MRNVQLQATLEARGTGKNDAVHDLLEAQAIEFIQDKLLAYDTELTPHEVPGKLLLIVKRVSFHEWKWHGYPMGKDGYPRVESSHREAGFIHLVLKP